MRGILRGSARAILGVIFLCGAAWGEAGRNRLPVPDAAQVQRALALVRDVFAEDYVVAKTTEQKAALANKILQEGVTGKHDPASRYALLRVARDMATLAGDAETALRAVEELGKRYRTDSIAMKAIVLAKVADRMHLPADHKKFLPVLGKAFDEAVAAERYDVARQVGKLAEASALKTRVAAAREEVDEKLTRLKQLEADYAKVKDALAVLETEPADPDANLAVGKYRCFVRGDWDGGLSNLALGGDATLKTLAEQELAPPDTAAGQVKLADGWWELAEKHRGATKTQMQLRSRRWYEKAAPNLAGLAEVKVTKRLEQLAASERPDTGRTQPKETGPVNLLALIDVKRDAVVGTWRIWNDTLMSPKQGGARIQIPYVPPANYDLVVEVTRLDGVDSFNVALVGGGKQFAAYIDGWRSKSSGLGLVDGKQPNNNPTRYSGRILTNGRKGTLVFSVREAGVQVSANGKTIVSWAEGFDRLSRDGDWTGPRTDCLLVGANKSVFQVHRMTLIPVTSPGRRKQ